jgi:hypothetical protein
MGYAENQKTSAIGNGGAGTPGVWDIITDSNYDFSGKIVCAFMSLDQVGGSFSSMEEETTIAHGGKSGISEPVAAKYLGYTYPQDVIFEGRYTKLIPATGKIFKIWFLK